MIKRELFFIKGAGVDKHKLASFKTILNGFGKEGGIVNIKKTMGHPHLKVWVYYRPLFLGCSRIKNCNISYDHMINHVVFNS